MSDIDDNKMFDKTMHLTSDEIDDELRKQGYNPYLVGRFFRLCAENAILHRQVADLIAQLVQVQAETAKIKQEWRNLCRDNGRGQAP